MEEFWNLSYGEIVDAMKSQQTRKQQKLKEKIASDYRLSSLIYYHVSKLLDSESKVPDMWEMYPELFREEKLHYEKKEKEAEMAAYKAKMIDYALRHNHSIYKY